VFKQLLLKKLMESKLKDMPAEQRDMIIAAVEKNPELFMQIAQETDAKVKSGMNQMTAAQQVFAAHQKELKRVLGQ
jgi:hypothetical protein